jgi:TonB family protein
MFKVRSITEKQGDGRYLVRDIHFRTGKPVQTYFLTADRLNRTGPYVSMHDNGKIWSRGQYSAGKLTGSWKSWHQNGEKADTCFFNQEGNIVGSTRSWYNDGKLQDSAFYHPDSAGHTYLRQFFEDGKLAGEGRVINREYDGPWKFYYPSGKLSSEEIYDTDGLVSITCYNEDGSPAKGECEPEIEASFPGGLPEWQKFISGQLTKRSRELIRKDASGSAVVQFIIDKDGKVIEPKIYQSSGTILDEFALDIISKSPAWKPAKQHNRFVKAYRRQPVTFLIQ